MIEQAKRAAEPGNDSFLPPGARCHGLLLFVSVNHFHPQIAAHNKTRVYALNANGPRWAHGPGGQVTGRDTCANIRYLPNLGAYLPTACLVTSAREAGRWLPAHHLNYR